MWITSGVRVSTDGDTGFKDVWYSSVGNNWAKATSSLFSKRIGAISLTTLKNKLWIIGGFGGGCSPSNFSDAWYSSDGTNWTKATGI